MPDSQISLIPDNAITELSKEIYRDVGHPVLKEVGGIGESLMKFVALPFKFLGLTAEQLEKKYAAFLEGTLKKVRTEDQVIPRAVITAPLLEHVKFVFDEDGLCEMFSNLLANSMHKDIENIVHPAYTEVLKQMSPVDAEFMNTFFKEQDIIETEKLVWTRSDFQKTMAVESLLRLGIINSISYDDRDNVAIILTNFGKVFRDLCMLTPSDIGEANYTYDIENLEVPEIGQLAFSDSFATAKKSQNSNRVYIRQRFEFSDVQNGSEIIILLRINNIGISDVQIERLYIDGGDGSLYPTTNKLPFIIKKGKYKDFVFTSADINKLLSAMVSLTAKYVVQTKTSTFDFPPTLETKKEINIYLKKGQNI